MPEEKYLQVEKWSEELGIPTTVYVAMATWIGAKQLAELHDLKIEGKDRKGDGEINE